MSNLVVRLKGNEEINRYLEVVNEEYEEDYGKKHTDGVAYQVDNLYKYTISKVYKEEECLVLETNDGFFINSKWVKDYIVDSNTFYAVEKPETKGENLIKLSDTFYYSFVDKNLIREQDIKVCTECGADTIFYKGICKECLEKLHFNINSYSFKPSPIFTGKQIKRDEEYPIWYGLELEYGLRTKTQMAKLCCDHKELYLKSDSSIRGGDYRAEMVTHPCSFTYLMGKDSFLNDLATLDAEQQLDSNGCHIHISRTSFKDDKHFGLFYFLLHSDLNLLQYIGGRPFTSYCSPTATGTVTNKSKVKNGESTRTVALNENPENTVEARFFNSSFDPSVVKSYIQFIDSMIKYTRYHKKRVSLTRWLVYVEKYKEKYKELYTRIKDYPNELVLTNITYEE